VISTVLLRSWWWYIKLLKAGLTVTGQLGSVRCDRVRSVGRVIISFHVGLQQEYDGDGDAAHYSQLMIQTTDRIAVCFLTIYNVFLLSCSALTLSCCTTVFLLSTSRIRNHSSFMSLYLICWPTLGTEYQGLKNNNNNNTQDNVYSAVIIARVHSLHLLNVVRRQLAPTLRPNQSTWAVSPPVGSHSPHPPSPFIITQPEGWYSFYCPTEGKRLSRPSWLVTYLDGLTTWKWSPIQVLTGADVD